MCVCDWFFQALDSFAHPDRAKNHTRQKLHVSGLLRLEVRDGGVGRVRLPWKAREKDLVQASLLASGSSVACGTITPAFTWRPPCACVSVSTFPFYEDTTHIGAQPTPYDLILTNYSWNDPITKHYILKGWGLGLQYRNVEGSPLTLQWAFISKLLGSATLISKTHF